MRLAFTLAWLLFVSSFTTDGIAAERVPATLLVDDVLTSPGQAVMLEARLTAGGLLSDKGLGGEPLEFVVGRSRIGTAMTGGDGRARLEYEPKMRGNLRLRVRVGDSPRVAKTEAEATLFSWERRRPILLVELAAIVTAREPSPALPLPSLPPGMSTAVPEAEAAGELKKLTDFYYNPLYVVRGDAIGGLNRREVRDWLTRNGFPSGPMRIIGSGKEALTRAIEELEQDGWNNVKAGIGRTTVFAEALIERRIETVIVSVGDAGRLPRKARTAKDWKEVRKKL